MTRRSIRRRTPPLKLEEFEGRIVPASVQDAFISQVYSTLLNRQVDAPGLSYWTAVDNAQGEQAVVQGVENSPEYLTSQVNGLYNTLLSRTGSSQEVNYWANQLQSGTTLNQVTADFLGSPEFLNDSGNSTVGLLNGIYQKELGRPLDAAGESYWGTQLASGTAADSVAMGIVTSPEASQDSVRADYQQLLGRPADGSGLAYWTSIVQQGGGQGSVMAGMLCSPEALANLPPFPGTIGSITPPAATGTVATHFLLITPPYVQAGTAAPVSVEALDASNHVVPSYTGTVQLSSTDTATTSGGAALPLTYTFQASDYGTHVFSVTPGMVGSETLSASDTATMSISGSVQLQVNAAPVVTHFLILTPPYVQAGSAARVGVEALDASNHVVPNYTGTVQLSSTDTATTAVSVAFPPPPITVLPIARTDTATMSGSVALPLTYTFQASDHGVHVFSVTPGMAGSETLTASDTATTSISGSVLLQVNAAPVATSLVVVAPPIVLAGVPTPVLVEALDASNHLVSNFSDTIQLSSSDTATTSGGAALPLSYTFQPSDHGAHLFLVTFPTSASTTLTATDQANSALSGSVTVTVGPQIVFPLHPGGPQDPGGDLFQNFPFPF